MLLRLWPEKSTVSFMSWRWIALVCSVVALCVSAATLSIKSLNWGIDFAGGTVIEIELPVGVSEVDGASQVRTMLAPTGVAGITVNTARGTGQDAPAIAVIRFGTQDPLEGEDGDDAQTRSKEAVKDALSAGFGVEDWAAVDTNAPGVKIRADNSVGPKVSGELFQAGIIALSLALLLMMAYITFQFEWQYALGAVAALFHDVFLTMGMFSLTGFEFNLATIAALLTIVGYSMNDTVIVFDRVREEERKYKKLTLSKVVDIAINATMSRTLLTSGTTLLALLSIFIFGGEVLRGMSFALIFGVLIGTYSSVFVASAVLLLLPQIRRSDKPREEVEGFTGV